MAPYARPCRYLYHSSSNPEAAFQSAKILRRIAKYPNIQTRLVGDFTHDQVYNSQLLPNENKRFPSEIDDISPNYEH